MMSTPNSTPPSSNMASNALGAAARWLKKLIWLSVLLGLLLVAIWLAAAYYFSYSKGERVGFVQKLSHKGWLCKTWEGEQVIALSLQAGNPEKFIFTVRDEALVKKINASIGQKVVLDYEQHKGLPSCFGDTEYFVKDVRPAP